LKAGRRRAWNHGVLPIFNTVPRLWVGRAYYSGIHGSFCAALSKRHCDKRLVITFNTSGKNLIFSLLVLEGVIIESRTEPRSRISLLLVNKFLLLTSG
jgi:hypothetical protein